MLTTKLAEWEKRQKKIHITALGKFWKLITTNKNDKKPWGRKIIWFLGLLNYIKCPVSNNKTKMQMSKMIHSIKELRETVPEEDKILVLLDKC